MRPSFEAVATQIIVQAIGRPVHLSEIVRRAQVRGARPCPCPRRCTRDLAAEIGARCVDEHYFFDVRQHAEVLRSRAESRLAVQNADDRYLGDGFHSGTALAIVYALLRRKIGASVQELVAALAASPWLASAQAARLAVTKLRNHGIHVVDAVEEEGRLAQGATYRHWIPDPPAPRAPLYVAPRPSLDDVAAHWNRNGPSRSGMVLALIRREEGATVAEAAALVAEVFDGCSTDVVTRAIRLTKHDHGVEINRRREGRRGWVYRAVA